ncbi:hypothetical protein ACG3RN_13800 [Pseudomonas aeruginosa]
MSDTLLHPSRFTHHHRVLHAVLLDEEGWFVLSDLVRRGPLPGRSGAGGVV